MKLSIKSIFKILIGISLLLLISGLFITYFFSEKVEKKVINIIQEQMTSRLQLEDVVFSLYDNFPSASVKITNLLAIEKEGFEDDTLFYAKKTYIDLSVYDVLIGTVDIKKVIVDQGIINIKYDSNDIANFLIFKTIKKNGRRITLKNLILINTRINFEKKGIKINWETKESLINFNENSASINAEIFSEKLIVNNQDYIHKKELKIQTNLEFIKDSILIKEGTKFEIENIKTKLSGSVFKRNIIDLNFSCEEQELNNIKKQTPKHLKSIYQSFEANAIINCTGNIKGLINRETNPHLNMICNIKKGNFNLKNMPFILKNVSLNAKITNGENNNYHDTKIEITNFDAKTENGDIKGNFTIQNLNKYHLTASLNSSWDLAEINHYFESSPFINLQGNLEANTQYSGHISFDDKFRNYFLNANHTSKTKIKEASFTYEDFPLKFNLNTAEIIFNNNDIKVKNSSSTIEDSDINFTGNITSLIAYILANKNKIDVTGEIKSTYIKFEELIKLKDITKEKSQGTMPSWISTNLNINIETCSYDDFVASDISGKLIYNDKTLKGEYIRLNSLGGSIAGDFKFYESKNKKLNLFSKINIKQLNIRNTFLAFKNFNQNFITSEHIKGIGTAQIQMQARWKQGFIFEEQELKLKSDLIIEKGELIQFKPLESLSNYVSLEDLKSVKFSTLENTIEIKNQLITIPNMEIKSSALSLFISGTHTFDQEINYQIKLLLSELLSTKFRKKNTQIKKNEFGEVNKNGKIFNTIYFKMTGNSENPKIIFDGIRIMEDVQKLIIKEKKVISTIIKEDILLIKEQEKQKEDQGVIIEWDDE